MWSRQREAAADLDQVADRAPFEMLSSEKKREEFLQRSVQEYANPREAVQLTLGLGHSLELAQLYLNQWRLEDADRFFGTLADNPSHVREFVKVGRLGHAIVLALEDRASDSAHEFEEILSEKDTGSGRMRFMLNRNPGFLRWVVQALDYDAANLAAAGQTLPRPLEEYRKPGPLPLLSPSLPRKPQRGDKAAAASRH
jgi:hypothetical protein